MSSFDVIVALLGALGGGAIVSLLRTWYPSAEKKLDLDTQLRNELREQELYLREELQKMTNKQGQLMLIAIKQSALIAGMLELNPSINGKIKSSFEEIGNALNDLLDNE